MKSINFILLMVLISFARLNGQEKQSDTIKKCNAITIDCSTMLFSSELSINYERDLFSFYKSKTYLNIGIGRFALSDLVEYGISSYSVPVSLNNIIGSRKNYFELDLGLRYLFAIRDKYGDNDNSFVFFMFNKLRQKNLYPIANLGYRYVGSNNGIFRIFIGLSGLGLGLGYCF